MRLLSALLRGPVPPAIATLDAWRESIGDPGWDRSVDLAVFRGFSADRLAFAFAGGYDAALRALVPGLDPRRTVCLCATEDRGAHPKYISTALADGAVTGRKKWVTLASSAHDLLVLVTAGHDGDRNVLRLVRIDASAPGVLVKALPETPFVPEIPHGEVAFEAAPVAEIYEGDGWTTWVKPFRTVEDVHVHAALLGHLVRVARESAWPREAVERLVAAIPAVQAAASGYPSDPVVHVLVAGMIAETARIVADIEPLWAQVAEPVRTRWHRDRSLLMVASKARAERREVAWTQLRA